MRRALALSCLTLSFVVVLPACKGAVKAGARVAREGASASTSGSEGQAERQRVADEKAEAEARAKEAEAHVAEAEAAVKALQARRPLELWQPELRVQAVLERDAKLHPDARLPAAASAALRIFLSIPAIGRGERERATVLLRGALDTLARPRPKLDTLLTGMRGSPDDEDPNVGRLREEAHLLLGNFGDASRLAWDRYARDRNKFDGSVTPGDLQNRLELGVLAKVYGSSWSENEAFKDAKPEVEAVLRAYKALDYVWGRSRGRALEQLDLADAAARKVTGPGWNFQTLGKPFIGADPHEPCASRYYEAVRSATFPWTANNYLVGPLLGLRLCILAMPQDKP